jgi:hypothetical protein
LVGNGDRIERSPLLTNRISAAPVVGTDGKIVGIVSEGDLMRRAEAGTGRRRSWWLSLLTGREVLAAEYIMGAIRWGLASRAAISLFMRPGTVLWSYAREDRPLLAQVNYVTDHRLIACGMESGATEEPAAKQHQFPEGG